MIPSIHSVDERLGDNEGGELSVNQRGANRVIIIGKVGSLASTKGEPTE